MILVIGVGSNSPDKEQRMAQAIELLDDFLSSMQCSSIYSTRAINGVDADYLNSVVMGNSDLPVDDVVLHLKELERRCGRVPGSEYVSLDLDLVVADGEVLRPKDMERGYFQRGYRELMGIDHGPSDRILR